MRYPDPFFIRSLHQDQAVHYAGREAADDLPPSLRKALDAQQVSSGRKTTTKDGTFNYVELEAQEQIPDDFKAGLPKALDDVKQKDIRIVPGAFNSTPHFISYFQRAACVLKDVETSGTLDIDVAVRRFKMKPESDTGIPSPWPAVQEKKKQGWETSGLGTSIQRFVKEEMAAVQEYAYIEDEKDMAENYPSVDHYFYVWHPGFVWYSEFERCQRRDPLGPAFGAYCSDLSTVCLRMRTDREALIAASDRGRDAVLHLLIPAYYPLIMRNVIAFSEDLLPMVIKADKLEGFDNPLAKFYMPEIPERLTLDGVESMPGRISANPYVVALGMSAVAAGLCGAAWTLASLLLPSWPPTVALMVMMFICCALFGALLGMVASQTPETPKDMQTFGDALFLGLTLDEE